MAGSTTGFPACAKGGLPALKHAIKHFFIDSAPGRIADMRHNHAYWPIDIVVNDASLAGAGWLHELGGPIWAAVSPLPLMLSSRDVAPFGPAYRSGPARSDASATPSCSNWSRRW